MRDQHPHPSQQPLLPLAMVVALVVGVICLKIDGKYSALGAGFAFAWFLVSFGLHGYAWIQRDHAAWQEWQRELQTRGYGSRRTPSGF